ncbi:MAG: hypothetical protein FJ403_07960 [Verrucomicrobia bacterium]|nr:hypothetical protein [Verrucomicrobiota bacterium]
MLLTGGNSGIILCDTATWQPVHTLGGPSALTMTTNSGLAFWKSDTLELLASQELPHHWTSTAISPKGGQLAVNISSLA